MIYIPTWQNLVVMANIRATTIAAYKLVVNEQNQQLLNCKTGENFVGKQAEQQGQFSFKQDNHEFIYQDAQQRLRFQVTLDSHGLQFSPKV